MLYAASCGRRKICRNAGDVKLNPYIKTEKIGLSEKIEAIYLSRGLPQKVFRMKRIQSLHKQRDIRFSGPGEVHKKINAVTAEAFQIAADLHSYSGRIKLFIIHSGPDNCPASFL